jgi:hypothetical protein
MSAPRQRPSIVRIAIAFVCIAVALPFFLFPGAILVQSIFDASLNGPGIPKLARQQHLNLTPRYERWAVSRVASGAAAHLSVTHISGTEWPLFGSVFYLRAEEAMQEAWEHDRRLFAEEPRLYARGAIDAAARLVADPIHATWVRRYWGDAYLERENVFYRMLLISALASHRRLTGSDEFVALLRAQTESLAAELDSSVHGLLDDYPGQCYPTDVIAAWEAIQRADRVLGTDHAKLIARAQRGFTGRYASESGLPPFAASSRTGAPHDPSRGSSNAAICTFAAPLWPGLAAEWYRQYERLFWQRDWLAAGFREYQRGEPYSEYTFDIDAGPVIRGHGFAACAFGIAAARAHGRFDQAYPLSIEAIAASWPLPGGLLLVPRLVSDPQHAPLIGEAAIFYQLTRPTMSAVQTTHSGNLPALVFICLAIYLLPALLLLRISWWVLQRRRQSDSAPSTAR